MTVRELRQMLFEIQDQGAEIVTDCSGMIPDDPIPVKIEFEEFEGKVYIETDIPCNPIT